MIESPFIFKLKICVLVIILEKKQTFEINFDVLEEGRRKRQKRVDRVVLHD